MSDLLAIETDSGLWLGGRRAREYVGRSRPAVCLPTNGGDCYAAVLSSGRLRGVRYQGERLRARAWTEEDQAKVKERKVKEREIKRLVDEAYPRLCAPLGWYDVQEEAEKAADLETLYAPRIAALKAEYRETYGHDWRGRYVFEVTP